MYIKDYISSLKMLYQRITNTIISLLCGIQKKKQKNKIKTRLTENNLMGPRREKGGKLGEKGEGD